MRASGPAPGDGGPLAVLRIRDFLRLYLAAVASATGSAVSLVSILWLVYTYTGDALAVTYVGLAGIAPGIAFGLFASVIADRYDRRRLMISADVARAAAIGFLAVYLALLDFHFPVVLAIVAVVNGFTVLFLPASNAMLPRIVERAHLEGANGLPTASTQVSQMVGAAAGAAAIAFAGVVPGLGYNALTYVVSAALLLQIAAALGRIGSPGDFLPGKGTVRRELGEGFGYMRANWPILEVTLAFQPVNLLGVMVCSYLVVYEATYVPGSAEAFGYLVAAEGGGVAAGALLVARIQARRFAGLLMALSVVVEGFAILGLAASLAYLVSLGLSAVVGLTIGLINTVYYATMQAIVPNAVVGRVLSVDMVGSFVGIPA